MTVDPQKRTITHADWVIEAVAKFGHPGKIRFVCPVCKHVASVDDYKKAGAEEGDIGVVCIGRYTLKLGDDPHKGPCDYAGYGLFRLNPVRVVMPEGDIIECFEFDKPTLEDFNLIKKKEQKRSDD